MWVKPLTGIIAHPYVTLHSRGDERVAFDGPYFEYENWKKNYSIALAHNLLKTFFKLHTGLSEKNLFLAYAKLKYWIFRSCRRYRPATWMRINVKNWNSSHYCHSSLAQHTCSRNLSILKGTIHLLRVFRRPIKLFREMLKKEVESIYCTSKRYITYISRFIQPVKCEIKNILK